MQFKRALNAVRANCRAKSNFFAARPKEHEADRYVLSDEQGGGVDEDTKPLKPNKTPGSTDNHRVSWQDIRNRAKPLGSNACVDHANTLWVDASPDDLLSHA